MRSRKQRSLHKLKREYTKQAGTVSKNRDKQKIQVTHEGTVAYGRQWRPVGCTRTNDPSCHEWKRVINAPLDTRGPVKRQKIKCLGGEMDGGSDPSPTFKEQWPVPCHLVT